MQVTLRRSWADLAVPSERARDCSSLIVKERTFITPQCEAGQLKSRPFGHEHDYVVPSPTVLFDSFFAAVQLPSFYQPRRPSLSDFHFAPSPGHRASTTLCPVTLRHRPTTYSRRPTDNPSTAHPTHSSICAAAIPFINPSDH